MGIVLNLIALLCPFSECQMLAFSRIVKPVNGASFLFINYDRASTYAYIEGMTLLFGKFFCHTCT